MLHHYAATLANRMTIVCMPRLASKHLVNDVSANIKLTKYLHGRDDKWVVVAYNVANKRIVIIQIASIRLRNKEKMHSLQGQMSMLDAVTGQATTH